MAEASCETLGEPLTWLAITSVSINAIGAAVWLLETLAAQWRRSRGSAAAAPERLRRGSRADVVSGSGECGQYAEMEPTVEPTVEPVRMGRLVELAMSQSLAVHALCCLLWLPLVAHSFRPPPAQLRRLVYPAVCAAIGRHLYFCARGWRASGGTPGPASRRLQRAAVPSVTHAVSAVCLALFLHQPSTLVLAALSLTTELGNVHLQLSAALGERRAGRLPCWLHALGVILSVLFNGLVYLLVLALALSRRSPMAQPPLAISLFFFYVTYSFIMNTYNIYLSAAGLCARLVDGRAARPPGGGTVGRRHQTALPPRALANATAALWPAGARQKQLQLPAAAADVSCADDALLVANMA